MNNVLIVGSIVLDSLKTPYGKIKDGLGGSVVYGSVASCLLSPVNMVGVVGQDFPQEHIELFKQKGINTEGLEVSQGKTFRWKAYYEGDMNQAHTVETQLNAFADFNPVIPESYNNSEFVFLGNIHPELQLNVLNQVKNPKFTMCDTMNLWISTTKEQLTEVMKRVNLVLVNECEARQFCETPNLVKAAKKILDLGPQYVIIKKGEHGALLFDKEDNIFCAPAYPLSKLKDPTGAGDTFAGGLIGYLARCSEVNSENLRKAIIVGSTLASYTAEEFSLNKLKEITMDDLYERYNKFSQLTQFDSIVPASHSL